MRRSVTKNFPGMIPLDRNRAEPGGSSQVNGAEFSAGPLSFGVNDLALFETGGKKFVDRLNRLLYDTTKLIV